MSQPAYIPADLTLCVFGENMTELGSSPITFTPNSDLISRTAGMQGDHAITKNPDRSAVLAFSLQQNARQNGVLAGFMAAADADNVWPELPCTFFDPSSSMYLSLKECSLSRRPALSFGPEQQDVQWELFVKEYEILPKDRRGGTSVVSIAATANSMYEGAKKILDLFK